MKTKKNKLVLVKDDYELLKGYIHSRLDTLSPESKNAEQLHQELKQAMILENESDLPGDVIRLNSWIAVQETLTGRELQFRLVLPAEANLTKQKLSVFAPLGIALIGYRKGQQVKWEMPAGEKVFYIKEVENNGVA
jgi:regulator of nucleoside diphosphate kinase